MIVAELMPTATANKKGLMSTSAFDIINSMIGIGATDVRNIIKLNVTGKVNFLCGCISNYTNPRLFSIFRTGSNGVLPKIKSFYKGESLRFYGVYEDINIVIYIEGLASWGEFSIVPFCGTMNSIEVVSEIPDNVESLDFIE